MPEFKGYEKEKLLGERKWPSGGFVVRRVLIPADAYGTEDEMEMRYAVGMIDGGYVGSVKDAFRLRRLGIRPQLADPNHVTCSIGFCEEDQKWYGWSHRAMFGFGIGEVVKEGDCAAESGWLDEYLREHPEEDKSLPVGFEAKTLEDAKQMAMAFAASVS